MHSGYGDPSMHPMNTQHMGNPMMGPQQPMMGHPQPMMGNQMMGNQMMGNQMMGNQMMMGGMQPNGMMGYDPGMLSIEQIWNAIPQGIYVKQKFDILEALTGCETANRYYVYEMNNQGGTKKRKFSKAKKNQAGVLEIILQLIVGHLIWKSKSVSRMKILILKKWSSDW
jgi:hypothetical protein